MIKFNTSEFCLKKKKGILVSSHSGIEKIFVLISQWKISYSNTIVLRGSKLTFGETKWMLLLGCF